MNRCQFSSVLSKIIFAFLVIQSTIVFSLEESSSRDNLQEYFQDVYENTATVGFVVGIIENGQTKFYCFGNKTVNGDPVDPNTIFEIGSISKLFTSNLLIDQVLHGNVNLDDPIDMYLEDVKLPSSFDKKITLRHLASHTSGLPKLPNTLNRSRYEDIYENFSKEELYTALETRVVSRAPGKGYEYSNFGSGLLSHILTIASGKTYEELLFNGVCSSFKMMSTSVKLSSENSFYMATGHHINRPISFWNFTSSTLEGMGGIRSSVRDLSKYLWENLHAAESILSDVLEPCLDTHFEASPEFQVGLGWHKLNAISRHSGGTAGFRSFIGFDAEKNKGVIILNNSSDDFPSSLGLHLLDPSKYPFEIFSKISVPQDTLKAYEGVYEIYMPEFEISQKIEVFLCSKTLITAVGKEIYHLVPLSDDSFALKERPGALWKFEIDQETNSKKILIQEPYTRYEAVSKI